MKKIVVFLILILFVMFTFETKTISIKSKSFLAGNTGEVKFRNLIMASSLAYENLPSSCGTPSNDGSITNTCMFQEKDIEGLSKEKVDKMTRIPTIVSEPGSKYYFWTFADISEMSDWTIVDYEQETSDEGTFIAYTFNKGNNYIIVFRGNEYIDVLEWGQDINNSIVKVYNQTAYADDYAVKIYNRYGNGQNNIYISGYSLGGYLAQSAAAELVSKRKTANLKEVVYFNSPGISIIKSIDSSSSATLDIKIENLKKLARDNKLILYTIKGDAISLLGKHYGKIRQMDPSNSTINHHQNYVNTAIETVENNTGDLLSPVAKVTEWINAIKKILEAVIVNVETATDSQLSKKSFNTAKMILNLNGNGYETSNFSSTGRNNSNNNIIKSNINSTMDEYNISSVNNLLTIAHEPDSFFCLNEDDTNVAVKIIGSNVNTNANGMPSSSGFYTNSRSDIKLKAETANGCAKRYTWYKCSTATSGCSQIPNETSSTYIVKQTDISEEGKYYYKVRASFNASYLEGTLKDNGYEYNRVDETYYTKLSPVFTIVIDRTAPTCYVSPSSKAIKRGKTDYVTLSCTDTSPIPLYSISSSSFSRDRIYASIENIVDSNNKLKIYIRQGSLALGSTDFTLKKDKITDYAGNKLRSDLKFTITVK